MSDLLACCCQLQNGIVLGGWELVCGRVSEARHQVLFCMGVIFGLCHIGGKKKQLFNLKRKKKKDYHSTIQEQFWHKLKLFFIFFEFLKFYFVTFIQKKIIIIIELRVCKFSTVGFESNLVLDTLNCPINLTIVCSLFYSILNYYLLKISELKTQLPKLRFNFFN